MDFREAISGEMPAPRDDEPAGLRQDILDELADHLACSFNRELLRGVQPEEASRRAIERFSNPSAVARRLWLDAMRGKIMAQRFWIATSLIVTVACVGLTGLVWSQSRRIAAAQAEANRRLAEAIDQTRAANEAILRRLETIAKASSKTSDWVPIKLRLTLEKPDGPPAVGYEVHLGRGQFGSTAPTSMRRITDDSGLADFGVVQPGDWEFRVQAFPWALTQSVNVLPDAPVDRTIACPIKGQVPVKVRVDWPKSLVERDLVAIAIFEHKGIKVGPSAWDTVSPGPFNILCLSRDGAMLDGPAELLPYHTDLPLSKQADLVGEGRVVGLVSAQAATRSNSPMGLATGHYELTQLSVFRPGRLASSMPYPLEDPWDVLLLLSRMDQSGSKKFPANELVIYGEATRMMRKQGRSAISAGIRADRFPADYLDKMAHRFEVRPGQPTEWVIPIPDEMARAADERAEKFVRLFEERVRSQPQPAPGLPGAR